MTESIIQIEPSPRNFCISDSNQIRTHNHLVWKRTLNQLAKLSEMAECLFMN